MLDEGETASELPPPAPPPPDAPEDVIEVPPEGAPYEPEVGYWDAHPGRMTSRLGGSTMNLRNTATILPRMARRWPIFPMSE